MSAMSGVNAASAWRSLRLGFAYMGLSLRSISREPAALFFIVAFPILFLVIFSSLLTFEIAIPEEAQGQVPVVTFSQYFVAGIMGVAIFGTSFNLLGNSLAIQQFDGTLKQLAATPLPKTSFFIGLVGTAIFYTLLQLVVMLILGVAAYGVDIPDAQGLAHVDLGHPARSPCGLRDGRADHRDHSLSPRRAGDHPGAVHHLPVHLRRVLHLRLNADLAAVRRRTLPRCAGSDRACARSFCPTPTSTPNQAWTGSSSTSRWCCSSGSSLGWACPC